jgi:tetratricopeptide (TPR) repeat protein
LLLVALGGAGLATWIWQRPEKNFREALRQNQLIVGPDSAFRIYLRVLADGPSTRLRRMGLQALPYLEQRGADLVLAWRNDGGLPDGPSREYALLSDWMQRIEPSSQHQAQRAFGLGLAALVEGQPESATTHFQQSLALQPNSSLAFQGLGQVWKARQRYGAARQCFERASQLDPGWWVPVQALADLYQQNLGNPMLGNELQVKAAALKTQPGNTATPPAPAPQAPGELPLEWQGKWMNEKGEAVLLAAKQLHIKPAPNPKPGSEIEHSYTWVTREQQTAAQGEPMDGSFGWEAKPMSTMELEASFEEYIRELRREKQEAAVPEAMADLRAVQAFPRGSYVALWRYAGGDCGYYNYIRAGDLLLEVQICKYGQRARLLRRAR